MHNVTSGLPKEYYYRLDPSIPMFRCKRCTRILPWIDFATVKVNILDGDKADEDLEETLECPYCHNKEVEEI